MAKNTTGSKFRQCAKTLSDREQAGRCAIVVGHSEHAPKFESYMKPQRPDENSPCDLTLRFNFAARTLALGLQSQRLGINSPTVARRETQGRPLTR